MWLLSTDRAELHYFVSPEHVPGGYAILSHVWDAQEQTYQETQALKVACAHSRNWRNTLRWRATLKKTPRDGASDKVRECCKLAEGHGFRWIWDDTCCIDKTSSSELSEAINSMFRWYSLARVCYAYLRDVPSDCDLRAKGSAFRKSRWHTRGWTLQELIAPELLVFVSADWQMLGAKGGLADLLEEITGIPADVLMFKTSFKVYSVAARMSWAAKRTTTRSEDEAYCLMGLFSINIPTLYGEGRNAFRRLQEEILRQSIDSSIFAWSTYSAADANTYLFASRPADFSGCRTVLYQPPLARSSQLTLQKEIRIPTFSVTSYGVLTSMSLAEFHGHAIGLLLCTDDDEQLGLILVPVRNAPDPQRPLYTIGHARTNALDGTLDSLSIEEETLVWSYREFYLAASPPPSSDPGLLMSTNSTLDTPIRVPPWALTQLAEHWSLPQTRTQQPWTGRPPATLTWTHTLLPVLTLSVHFGLCNISSGGLHVRPHWANVEIDARRPKDRNGDDASPSMTEVAEPTHQCPADHISQWGTQPTRVFALEGDAWWEVDTSRRRFSFEVTLSFSSCPFNPSTTIVLDEMRVEQRA